MVALAIALALVLLLILNAIVVSNTTHDARVDASGGQIVSAFGGDLEVVDEGKADGPPIVLIHGYGSSLRWYDALAARLADRYRVIRLDLLGHGGSEAPSAGYEIDAQARTVASVLAELHVSGATVVGHSMGMTVATSLAEQSPDLVARLVDVDQAPDNSYGDLSFSAQLGYVPVIGQAVNRLGQIVPASVIRDQYEQAFAPGFSFAAGFENPDQPVEDYRDMTYTAYKESHEAEEDYVDAKPLDQRFTELGLPLLVVFGTEDQIYDADRSADAFRSVPGARVELIEGSGHSPMVEAPEKLEVLIDRFVAETSAPR